MQPDLAAFAGAIQGFREKVGTPTIFLTPLKQSWPEGTILDPETGRPYDPMIEATDEGEVLQAEVTAIVVLDSAFGTHLKDDETNQPFGSIVSGELVAIIDFAEWEMAELDLATTVVVLDSEWEITQTTDDSVGGMGGPDRVLVRARQK